MQYSNTEERKLTQNVIKANEMSSFLFKQGGVKQSSRKLTNVQVCQVKGGKTIGEY
jgi:hypothetical protein